MELAFSNEAWLSVSRPTTSQLTRGCHNVFSGLTTTHYRGLQPAQATSGLHMHILNGTFGVNQWVCHYAMRIVNDTGGTHQNFISFVPCRSTPQDDRPRGVLNWSRDSEDGGLVWAIVQRVPLAIFSDSTNFVYWISFDHRRRRSN